MNPLETLSDVLVRCQVVTTEQWQNAVADTHGEDDLIPLLDRLQQQPAWWSPDRPALSNYQRKKAIRHFGDGRLGQLERVLRIKQYLIAEPVGAGGMGLVYRGWDLDRSRPVALKRVLTDSPQARKRFRREARIQERLDHDAIARFYESVSTPQRVMLVLEWINGHDLVGEVESRGRIPWREVASWAGDLLDALDHAHQRQIIHRDIKPANVMVHRPSGGRPMPKLLDMGLAKCTAATIGASLHGSTQAGLVLGTYIYMPPEQWRGVEHVVPASDVYSLGGTLYYALAGRPPFQADNPAGYFVAHSQNEPASLTSIRPDVPAALDDLIRRMLSKDPTQRGTPARLRAEVRQLLRAAGPRSNPILDAKPRTPTPRPKPSSSASTVIPPMRSPRPLPSVSPSPSRATMTTVARERTITADEQETSVPLGVASQALLEAGWRWLGSSQAPAGSMIEASRQAELRQHGHEFLLSLSAWIISLGRPFQHPGRVAVAVVGLMVMSKLLGLW